MRRKMKCCVKRMKKPRSSGLLKKSILERGGCIKNFQAPFRSNLYRTLYSKKNVKRYYITYMFVFLFPRFFRHISLYQSGTDAVKFAYTSFVIKLASNDVSDANSFHPFMFRKIYCAHSLPLIGSRPASPRRLLLRLVGFRNGLVRLQFVIFILFRRRRCIIFLLRRLWLRWVYLVRGSLSRNAGSSCLGRAGVVDVFEV